MDANPPSRLSNRAKSLLVAGLVVFCIAFLLAAAETAVRVRQYIKYGYTSGFTKVYEVDARTGLRIPRPNAVLGPIRINSLGFRGPEIPVPKPEGTIRIAFLGASTTFCAEVDSNESTWPDLVTASLRRHFPDTPIDYVNGGVSGYSVRNSLRNLELRVAPLQPDIIVVYHATNDLSGELREIAAQQGNADDRRPPESSWLSRYSLLWSLVTKNLRVLAAQRSSDRGTAASVNLDPQEIGTGFREDMTQLIRAAKATGATVALATFAVHMRESQSDQARRKAMETAVLYMPGFTFDQLVLAYRRYNTIIREIAQGQGVILVGDEDSIPGDPAHFVDSVHFSNAGSRTQAERVSRALLGSGALPEPSTAAERPTRPRTPAGP